MSTELTPMQKVQDLVRDRIRAEFASLIPDEMWANMVASVVAEFTTDTRNQYNREVIPSPLKKLIRNEVESIAKESLKAELSRLDGNTWNAFGQKVASDAIKKMIADNFSEILASVQAGFVEHAVIIATNNIREGINRMR